MNKTILLTALLSACILASCGSKDTSSDSSHVTEGAVTTPTVQTESSAAEESSSVSESDVSEPEQESTPQTETSENESSAEDDHYKELLASVDRDHSFVQASGDSVTFGELLDQGYANVTADGCGFCLVKSGAGAGSVYFEVKYTENGGGSFRDGGFVSLHNGSLEFFPIEDGRLLAFGKASADLEENPFAAVMTFEENEVKTQEYQQYFDGVALDDGSALAPKSHVSVKGEYLGGYKLHFTLTDDESGKVLLDTDAVLDSVSLGLVKPDAAE